MDKEEITQIVSTAAKAECTSRDLDVLSEEVRELREHCNRLAIQVSQAAGPRATDWKLALGALSLVMAIGAAAMSPLYFQINETKLNLGKIETQLAAHEKLPLHQGAVYRLDGIEKQFDVIVKDGSPITRERLAVLEKDIKRIEAFLEKTPK